MPQPKKQTERPAQTETRRMLSRRIDAGVHDRLYTFAETHDPRLGITAILESALTRFLDAEEAKLHSASAKSNSVNRP